MPVSFEFINRLTGQPDPLADIDAEICRVFGRECDPVNFSIEYEAITDIGISCCYHGSFSIETFREMTRSMDAEMQYNILQFLDGKYIFRAWR